MKRHGQLCLIACLVLSACGAPGGLSKKRIQNQGAQQTAITILLDKRFILNWGKPWFRQGNEEQITECIGDEMVKLDKSLRIISSQNFRDNLFPWFEYDSAPKTAEEFATLLQKPLIRERLKSLGLRHVIILSGNSTFGKTSGWWGCGGSMGAGGCFGYEAHEEASSLQASVWDINSIRSIGNVEANASGQSKVLAIMLPFYIDSDVEEEACEALAGKLIHSLEL